MKRLIPFLAAICALAACGKTNPEYNGYQYVDLGLPSGLKWATCNVGAAKPEETGDYFAWGETETYYEVGHTLSNEPALKPGKQEGYYWPSYKWSDNSGEKFFKYVLDSAYGTVDNKKVLDKEDDAAHAARGGKWRTPTPEEWEELTNNTFWEWTNENGITGYRIKSKINDKSFFLPAVGHRFKTQIYYYTNKDYADYGNYWTASIVNTESGDSWMITPTNHGLSQNWRYYGFPIRPVFK